MGAQQASLCSQTRHIGGQEIYARMIRACLSSLIISNLDFQRNTPDTRLAHVLIHNENTMDENKIDESNQALFNKLKIFGPLIFFIVVFVVLYKFTSVGIVLSALIAGIVAVLDYFMLIIVMKKVSK